MRRRRNRNCIHGYLIDNTNRFPVLPSDVGSLHVYVKDAEDNPVSGVTLISLIQAQQQPPLTGTTDHNGYKVFDGIKVGSYIIQASKTGYLTANETASVLSNQITTITIRTHAAPHPPAVPLEWLIILIAIIAILGISVVLVKMRKQKTVR